MSAAYEVLGVGECSLDEVARLERTPRPGEKLPVREWERLPGGQVASALLGCARLGHSAALVSSVGDDGEADLALAPLRAAGVDLWRVRRVAGASTRRAWIWVDSSGERTVLWRRDERLALAADAVGKDDVRGARVVLVDATDLALSVHTARLARALGRACVVDADAPQPGLRTLLELASHPVIPEPLARALYGSAEAAVHALAGAGATLPVVTRGPAGALAWIDGGVRETPAFAIQAVDTTGAGDAFRAGLAHGVLDGLEAAALLRVAHAVAACSCRARGAQLGLPTRTQLAEFLAAAPPPARG